MGRDLNSNYKKHCYQDEQDEEEVLDTPFRCPNCGKPLGWYDYCECLDEN